MRALLLGVAGVLSTGCASLPPAAPVAGPVINGQAAAQAQQQRAQALGLDGGDCAGPGWAIVGRIALANGQQGGSARVEWTQGGGQSRLLLSAPITRQNWRLDIDARGGQLHGLADGVRSDPDPARLLRDATGWDIPVAALGCWLRAVAADPSRFGTPRIDYDTALLPQRIEQDGWVIDYQKWVHDPFTSLQMPARIQAVRGEVRIRLIVDRWELE